VAITREGNARAASVISPGIGYVRSYPSARCLHRSPASAITAHKATVQRMIVSIKAEPPSIIDGQYRRSYARAKLENWDAL
jgi:hypothetical protein